MLSYLSNIQMKTPNIFCSQILTINLSLLTKKTISDACPESKGKKGVSRSSWPHTPFWHEFRKTWRSLLRTLKWKAISPLSFPSQTKLITNLEIIIKVLISYKLDIWLFRVIYIVILNLDVKFWDNTLWLILTSLMMLSFNKFNFIRNKISYCCQFFLGIAWRVTQLPVCNLPGNHSTAGFV